MNTYKLVIKLALQVFKNVISPNFFQNKMTAKLNISETILKIHLTKMKCFKKNLSHISCIYEKPIIFNVS